MSLVAPSLATPSLAPLTRLVVPGPPSGAPLLVVGIVWIHGHRCLHLRWDRTAVGLPCMDYIVRVGYVAYTWQVVLRNLVPQASECTRVLWCLGRLVGSSSCWTSATALSLHHVRGQSHGRGITTMATEAAASAADDLVGPDRDALRPRGGCSKWATACSSGCIGQKLEDSSALSSAWNGIAGSDRRRSATGVLSGTR